VINKAGPVTPPERREMLDYSIEGQREQVVVREVSPHKVEIWQGRHKLMVIDNDHTLIVNTLKEVVIGKHQQN